MRTLFVAVLSLLITSSLIAATNETATLLKAHRVPHALYIRVSGTDLQYATETPRDFVVLVDGDTFTSAQPQVDFAYPEFNPFKIRVETSEDLRDDPTSAAVAAFLQKVLDTAGGVFPIPVEGAADGVKTIAASTAAVRKSQLDIEGLKVEPKDPCSLYKELDASLKLLRGKMNAQILLPNDVSQWVKDSRDADGVGTTRGNITNKIKEIDDNEKAIVALLKTINEKFGAAGPDEVTCGQIRASTFATLLDISQLASQTRAKNLSVRASLQDLNKALEPFAESTRWRDGTSFIFLKPSIDPTKIDAVTVKINKREFDPEKLTFGEATVIKKKLDLRQYQRIVPEVAAALIYTDLAYPTWGTAVDEKSGKTIVTPGKSAKFPVQGAMVLNGVIPVAVGPLYPALQFGISTAKEFPGFLGGIAIRSIGTKQFSISVGKMLTWYRTLGTLHDGSVVTGTADIEKDMKLKRAPLAWYGGVQYSF